TCRKCQMVPEVHQKCIPYTTCKLVREEFCKMVTCRKCCMVPETHVKCIPYTTCKMIREEQCKMVTCRKCQMVPEVHTQCVPYTLIMPPASGEPPIEDVAGEPQTQRARMSAWMAGMTWLGTP